MSLSGVEDLFELLENKNDEELKQKFKESLKSKTNKKSDLTFIDLARTGKSWAYDFSPTDDESFLFDYSISL